MQPYHKIQSIFKRDVSQKPARFTDEFTLPEFEYLADNEWVWREKIDGTNVRVSWDCLTEKVLLGGRTDRAQMPMPLLERLNVLFYAERFAESYSGQSMTLYGEGYGAGIQSGGNYSQEQDFILFDVQIGDYWLRWPDVLDIASHLGLKTVPIVGVGSLYEAIALVQGGFKSEIGTAQAEGLVLLPLVELATRTGHRVITKVKTKDYR